jgi:hypothetical protein
MQDLGNLSLIVHGHRWSHLREWVDAVDALADLTDAEIEALALGSGTAPAARPAS